MSDIFQNIKYWQNFDQERLDEYAMQIFCFYRENGFPFFDVNLAYRKKELEKLLKYDDSCVVNNNIIKQTMHGLALCWSYMPHSFSIKCKNFRTPMDIFNDDTLFFKAIKKRLKIGTFISHAGIRKILKSYVGVQTVSNFRPTAASAIYNLYSGEGAVLDMSSGFGGRLLGAEKSKKVKEYIGLEPSTATYTGLIEMIKDLNIKKVKIMKTGSEDYFKKGYFDLCFTSPPYFNLERYSDEPSQSYIKFNDVSSWYDGFFKATIQNSCLSLKDNGYLILNVKNTKELPDFENKTHLFCREFGLSYIKTLKLSLSQQSFGKGYNNFNFEPVIIYRKGLSNVTY